MLDYEDDQNFILFYICEDEANLEVVKEDKLIGRKQEIRLLEQAALRDRMGIFQEKTKTTKTLVYTFVTTFGIADGIHHSIVNSEVTMGDLFG